MPYGYITKLHENLERIDLYDRSDRIPFDRLERFFKDNLK